MNREIAEIKAQLVYELHCLCRAIPPELGAASVQQTDKWAERIRYCRQIKGDVRASVQQLSDAIEEMRQPFPTIEPLDSADFTLKKGGSLPTVRNIS